MSNIKSPEPNTFTLDIEVEQVALFVTLNINDVSVKGTFSDNAFMMTQGKKTISFTSKTPLTLSEFQRKLQIWSLYDLASEDIKNRHAPEDYINQLVIPVPKNWAM